MREPEPTPADQWSGWETDPETPRSWPGLGNEHRTGGLEIERGGVKAVSGKLLDLGVEAGKYDYLFASVYIAVPTHWALPYDLSRLFHDADAAVHKFWRDLHAEVGMAGLLIERACSRYDLADNPLLGDMPLDVLDARLVERMTGDAPSNVLWEPSDIYPNGSLSLRLPESGDHGVGHMTAAKAADDITWYPRSSGMDFYEQMAESLVTLANTILLRAQDLRDSPWHGEAADVAQSALRRIYANATALAAVVGNLHATSRRFVEIANWCRSNFEQMVDPDRGGWDEFWDRDGSADSRTRSFLEQAKNEFLDVYRLMPERIKEDLPGLLVTDTMLDELRERADWVAGRPKDSQWHVDNDESWLRTYRPILQGYERAEEQYG
jgi:hypothetical protein